MTPTNAAMLPSLAPMRAGSDDTTDAVLVEALRAGDDRAFEQLYGRYHKRIAAYVNGMVRDHGRAEDITQEVFLSALRRMRATDRPIAFKPWIYEIAKNACIDQFRRARRGEEVSYDAGEGEAGSEYSRTLAGGSTPDVEVEGKLALDNLRGAFGGLSETHHQILVMRELEGLSYREIGERLGLSRPAVESTLFRARRRLTEEYEELISGERCRRVQAIIAGANAIAPGARDKRRLGAHVSHCQSCRRHAHAAGLDTGAMTRRGAVRAKIAGFLPLPLFFRRRFDLPSSGGHGGGTVSQWSAQLGANIDPSVVNWVKAAAAATTVAVVGVGAGEGTRHLTHSAAGPAPVVATPHRTTEAIKTAAKFAKAPAATAPGAVVRTSDRTVTVAGTLGAAKAKAPTKTTRVGATSARPAASGTAASAAGGTTGRGGAASPRIPAGQTSTGGAITPPPGSGTLLHKLPAPAQAAPVTTPTRITPELPPSVSGVVPPAATDGAGAVVKKATDAVTGIVTGR